MTIMTPTEVLGLPRGRPLTCDDLDAMPDDGHRYELIDGILLVSPAPRTAHQRAAAHLFRALDQVISPSSELLFAPVDVVLADDTVLQPDLLIADRDLFTERGLPAAPVLAVEIGSPSSRNVDLLLKKERLERAGCPHYWVVDPGVPSVTAWSLVDGVYRRIAHATGDESFAVTEPFAVVLSPADLVR